jgi:hypothetical protein
MRKKTKENKEELKTGGIIIMYVVKKKKRKKKVRVGTQSSSQVWPEWHFRLLYSLFSFEFCSDNFATVPLKNVCFSCGDFYDARRWCHDDFTHVFWGGRVGGTERKRRLNCRWCKLQGFV